jgi:hypothetical protein
MLRALNVDSGGKASLSVEELDHILRTGKPFSEEEVNV